MKIALKDAKTIEEKNHILWVFSKSKIMRKNNFTIFFGIFLVSMLFVPAFISPTTAQDSEIPAWIKNNAGWWSEGQIDDTTFLQGIQFLIKEGIMIIPPTETSEYVQSQEVPAWIKNNAGWWANNLITDNDFIKGIEFLVENGIIIIYEDDNLEKNLLETRKDMIKLLWKNEQLPSHLPQHIETNIEDETFNNLGLIKQIDKFTVDMKYGVNSIIFLIHPEIQSHDELIIYHNGHGPYSVDLYEGKNTIRFFLEKGYPVLVVSMPLEAINNNPTVIVDEEPILLDNHTKFKFIVSEEFNPLSYFFEPLAVILNFLDKEYEFKKYHLMGISGGGWTSSVYPAIDQRISTSFSVAGGVPLDYVRSQDKSHWEGDKFSSVASYYDIYALDTLGERKFIQIFNSHDNCCWGKGQDFGFIELVKEKVSKLENSYYDFIVVENSYHKFIPKTIWIIFSNIDDENLEYFNNDTLRISNNDFSDGLLENNSFEGDDLRHADFSGSTTNAVDFSNSDLVYSTFYASHSFNTDFSNSDLSFADFSYSIISEGVFENTLLRKVDFQFSRLGDIDFRHSFLEDINFKNTWCIYCNFDGMNIQSIKTPPSQTYNNFPGSTFRGADFRGWDYHKIDFTAKIYAKNMTEKFYVRGTILSNADFSGMDLTRMVFSRNGVDHYNSHAQLDNANLSQSDLSMNDLRFVVLTNANLEGANLNCINHSVCDLS